MRRNDFLGAHPTCLDYKDSLQVPSHDRFGEFPKGIDLIAGDNVPGKWH